MSQVKDESEKFSSSYLNREEIRGLFTLGLLAVVASLRIQYLGRLITIPVSERVVDLTPLFDSTIILWSLYAFFMMLGVSDDILGEKGARALRFISKYYLFFSYFLIGYDAISLYYSFYPLQSVGITIIMTAIILYWLLAQSSPLQAFKTRSRNYISK